MPFVKINLTSILTKILVPMSNRNCAFNVLIGIKKLPIYILLSICILPENPPDWIAHMVVTTLLRPEFMGLTPHIWCYILAACFNVILLIIYIVNRSIKKIKYTASRLTDAVCLLNCVYLISFLIRGCPDPKGWWPFLIFSLFYIILLIVDMQEIWGLYKFVFLVLGVEFGTAVAFYALHINQYITPGFGMRTCGTYSNPNTLYPLCLLAIPISLGLAWTRVNKAERLFYLIIFVLGLLTLLFTYQRAGWIALAISMIYMATRPLASCAMKQQIRAAILIFSCLLFFSSIFIRTGWQAMGNKNDRSFWGRTAIWSDAIQIIARNPVVGAGQGNYAYLQHQSASDYLAQFNPRNTEPKSLYLSITADYGIVGLLVFCYLPCVYVLTIKNVFRVNSESGFLNMQLAINTAFIAILTSAIVDTPILESSRVPATALTAVILALMCKMIDYVDSQDKG